MRISRDKRDSLTVRIISAAFVALALAIFKPFGLDAMQWQAYLHLFLIWVIGVGVCIVTDSLLTYLFKMPSTTQKGVSYIIHRNLWFQLINTPLIALAICLYRHFVLSGSVEGNLLSWGNYLETLIIIAFCSFVIGLYWRFRFRSLYLAAELEEVRQLNEQLSKVKEEVSEVEGGAVTLAGTTSESITLPIDDLLYIESVGNYVKVCYLDADRKPALQMLRATSKQMEETLKEYSMVVRCHRAFLVNLQQVEKIVSQSGTMQLKMRHTGDTLPVSRSNTAQVKAAFQ
jgi:hypothetical protein